MFDVPYCCGFFGHSHAARLLGTYLSLVAERGEDNIKPLFKFGLLRSAEYLRDEADDLADPRAVLPSLVADVMSPPEPVAIIATLKGSATTVYSLPRHPRPFDFVLPGLESDGVAEGAELIPYGLVKRMIAGDMRRGSEHILRVLATLAPGKPVYLVPPPPPVPSEDFLSRQKSRLCQRIATTGVNPRNLRRKFWLAYLDVLGEFAASHGAEVIDLPPEVYDAQGFLAERYWDDATHGNAGFSRLLLETIDRFMSGRLAR